MEEPRTQYAAASKADIGGVLVFSFAVGSLTIPPISNSDLNRIEVCKGIQTAPPAVADENS